MDSLSHLAEQKKAMKFPQKPTTIDLIGGINCHICNLTFSNKKEFDSHYVNHKTGEEETVYTCVVCHRQIPGYRSFQGHCYLNHVAKDKFKCDHCSKMFPKLCLLTHHVVSIHTFICTTCDLKFPTKQELIVHEIFHKMEKSTPPYPCLSCSKNIDNSDTCEIHIDEHSTIFYPCPICEETLPNKVDAIKHLTKHFGDEHSELDFTETSDLPNEDSSIDITGGILCCICDDLFKKRTEFDLHFKSKHNELDPVYTCVICKKQYDKYVQFGQHCYFHLSKNRFECDDCGKLFSRLSLLVMHTEVYHSIDAVDKPYACNTCGHAFKTSQRLLCHRRDAHSLVGIDCPHCGEIFDSHRDMLLHQREHKNFHQNSCRYCCLQFNTLSSCEQHVDVHRIKNYSCPICNKEYKEKYRLVKHISVHFESVLHICKICSKTYNTKSRLEQHKKTHLAVRSHKCTYCGKGFVKSYDLQQHTNIHTGAKPYKCPNCPKSFASSPNWLKHLQRIHNVTYNERKQIFETYGLSKKAAVNAKPVTDAVATRVPEQPGIRESDEGTVDSLDPMTIQKELEMFCDNSNAQNCEMIFDIEDMLPENSATPVTVTLESIEPSIQNICVPPEYGPEFVNRGVETPNVNGDFIDLDDHIMPHIDPLLTIRNELLQANHITYDNAYEQNVWKYQPNAWEPPIVDRIYPTYPTYPTYDDITELSCLSSL